MVRIVWVSSSIAKWNIGVLLEWRCVVQWLSLWQQLVSFFFFSSRSRSDLHAWAQMEEEGVGQPRFLTAYSARTNLKKICWNCRASDEGRMSWCLANLKCNERRQTMSAYLWGYPDCHHRVDTAVSKPPTLLGWISLNDIDRLMGKTGSC